MGNTTRTFWPAPYIPQCQSSVLVDLRPRHGLAGACGGPLSAELTEEPWTTLRHGHSILQAQQQSRRASPPKPWRSPTSAGCTSWRVLGLSLQGAELYVMLLWTARVPEDRFREQRLHVQPAPGAAGDKGLDCLLPTTLRPAGECL